MKPIWKHMDWVENTSVKIICHAEFRDDVFETSLWSLLEHMEYLEAVSFGDTENPKTLQMLKDK